MPPRRRSTANSSLTPENLEALASALAEGRRATVYLIEPTPSLGLPEGTSAKVVGISGTTLTIRPKGVDDELPFEADELRITRNAPGPAPKGASAPARSKPAAPQPAAPQPAVSKPAVSKPAAPEPAVSKPAAPQPAAPKPAVSKPAVSKPAVRKGKKGPESVSVTIHAGADNDWSVTVTHGARRPGKARSVSPEAVSRAVDELGDEAAAQAVEAVISYAREEAAQRVAELRRQLEEAQTTLAALEGGNA